MCKKARDFFLKENYMTLLDLTTKGILKIDSGTYKILIW